MGWAGFGCVGSEGPGRAEFPGCRPRELQEARKGRIGAGTVLLSVGKVVFHGRSPAPVSVP